MRTHLLSAVLALGCASTTAAAEEASMFDYFLGDHIIDYPLSEFDVIAHDMEGFAGQTFIKALMPNDTHLVFTFRGSSPILSYMENDWIDRETAPKTNLNIPGIPEFTFGQTRAADLQKAFGGTGFHYECRQLQPVSAGLLSLISYEIPERPDAVYTFVVEYSRDLAERGLVDLENIDLTRAVLVATMVSRPSYNAYFWCPDRVPYTSTPMPASVPEESNFEDFLPGGKQVVERSEWRLEPELGGGITKAGAVTWGDHLHVFPQKGDCTTADVMAWAHTSEVKALKALEGQEIAGNFNLLLAGNKRVPLKSPVELTMVIQPEAAIENNLSFAVGAFRMGLFDFERIISAEGDMQVLGFGLEFEGNPAGLKNNYWSLEGLFRAGNAALSACEEASK